MTFASSWCWCFRNPTLHQWMGIWQPWLQGSEWWNFESCLFRIALSSGSKWSSMRSFSLLKWLREMVNWCGWREPPKMQLGETWEDGFVDAKKQTWECLMSEFLEHVLFSTSSWTMLTFSLHNFWFLLRKTTPGWALNDEFTLTFTLSHWIFQVQLLSTKTKPKKLDFAALLGWIGPGSDRMFLGIRNSDVPTCWWSWFFVDQAVYWGRKGQKDWCGWNSFFFVCLLLEWITICALKTWSDFSSFEYHLCRKTEPLSFPVSAP